MNDHDVHVYPNGDIVIHDIAENCVCIPEVMPVERDDGTVGFMYVHHSLDGRELLPPAGSIEVGTPDTRLRAFRGLIDRMLRRREAH